MTFKNEQLFWAVLAKTIPKKEKDPLLGILVQCQE
jgi:hypothetical protein